jgi:hypothetical protein
LSVFFIINHLMCDADSPILAAHISKAVADRVVGIRATLRVRRP